MNGWLPSPPLKAPSCNRTEKLSPVSIESIKDWLKWKSKQTVNFTWRNIIFTEQIWISYLPDHWPTLIIVFVKKIYYGFFIYLNLANFFKCQLNSLWTDRLHKELCGDFIIKLLKCIFGGYKLQPWTKKNVENFRANLRRIINVRPYENWKILDFFFQFYLQKCILEFFWKNLHTILNAVYPSVENFKSKSLVFFLWKCNFYPKLNFA